MIIAMRISTFFYTIKQGLKNIWKNKMFSLASIATMTACIFLFGLFYTIVTNFQSMVKDAESGVAVTVFFDEGISQDKIDEIGDLIRARAEVSNLEFVSADDAWDSFKQTYFEGNEAAAESFAGDNPLANDASYSIYMNDISMQQTLVTYLQSVNGAVSRYLPISKARRKKKRENSEYKGRFRNVCFCGKGGRRCGQYPAMVWRYENRISRPVRQWRFIVRQSVT